MTGAPHLPGFGRCGIPRLSTGDSLLQQVLMSLVICTLHTQEPRFAESHICQNRADVGHPSFVTEQAVRNAADRLFPSRFRAVRFLVLPYPPTSHRLAKHAILAS